MLQTNCLDNSLLSLCLHTRLPSLNRRRSSFSGPHFPTVEHSAPQNVTSPPSLTVFLEMFNRSFSKSHLECPRSDFAISDTIVHLLLTYLLTDLLTGPYTVRCTGVPRGGLQGPKRPPIEYSEFFELRVCKTYSASSVPTLIKS